jgi:hypothetical protein
MLSAAVFCACGRGNASQAQRPRDAAELVRQVSVGRTTAADVERQLGTADERPPDGSLIYRFDRRRGNGDGTVTDTETVTLRFEGGVLSKVCRARS